MLIIWIIKQGEGSNYTNFSGLDVYVYDFTDVKNAYVYDFKAANDVCVYYFKDVNDLHVFSVYCVNDRDALDVNDFGVYFYFCYFNLIQEVYDFSYVLNDLDYVLPHGAICFSVICVIVLHPHDVTPVDVICDDVHENVNIWLLIIAISTQCFI